MQPGGGTDPLGWEGGHSHQQPAQNSASAPAGSTGPHRAGIVVLCHQGILALTALQTAPEPRLQGQGGSTYPEPQAAGRRRLLASPRSLEREQGRIKVNSKGRDGEERDGGTTGAKQHTAASLCLSADAPRTTGRGGDSGVCTCVTLLEKAIGRLASLFASRTYNTFLLIRALWLVISACCTYPGRQRCPSDRQPLSSYDGPHSCYYQLRDIRRATNSKTLPSSTPRLF